MAYYGIPSAAQALTASIGNDTVEVANLGGTLVTAQSIYGADGNDVISLGAVGTIVTGSATMSGTLNSGDKFSGDIVATVVASSTRSTSLEFLVSDSGTFVTGIQFATASTSEQAVRTVNAAYLQGNAGNDSIAFGEGVTRISATTFAGGAGNDVIGSYKNFNDTWAAAAATAPIVSSNIEGGGGNDTIYIDTEQFSALNVNANKGDDKVEFAAFSAIDNSIIGLGAGNDSFTGDLFKSAASSTIAGGKGNDTIDIAITDANAIMIGGDRANANPLDGDGNDSIYIGDAEVFSGNTIYGGGGNDTVTFSGDMTASVISLGAGADVYSANGGANDAASLYKDTTIGLGAGDDLLDIRDGTQTDSAVFNLGKGADSTDFGGADVGSATDFANTTIYGVGADLSSVLQPLRHRHVQIELKYAANSESTISAYDTVAVDIVNSGTYSFDYRPGASRATFSAAGVTATNGVVTFSSNYATDLTARASAVASNSSDGNAAAFLDGDGNAYLFVKGSSDNLLVKVGSAASLSAVTTLTIGTNNTDIDVTIG